VCVVGFWRTHDRPSLGADPEPASMALLACAMGGAGVVLRRRRRVRGVRRKVVARAKEWLATQWVGRGGMRVD